MKTFIYYEHELQRAKRKRMLQELKGDWYGFFRRDRDDTIIELSNVIGGLLWGWYTQAFLILVGVYMLVGTKFYVFRKFGYIMKNTLGKMFEKTENNTAGLTSVQAVLGALAGTIGMGNIAGTASAISIGGPGAVFWMWLFAFLGMSVKTAEVTLAVHYREVAPDGSSIYGGPMYYMRKAMNAKALSVVFTIGLILNCVFMASTMQTHTIIESVNRAYNINPYLIAAVCVVLAALAVLGGLKSIGKVCEIMVPVMTVVWFAIAIIVIGGNIADVPHALASIFINAFTPTSAVGGFVGASIATAIQQGAARGTGSNDAGVGVAPCIHATADVEHPFKQGLWGTAEVFIDTIVVCTMTALIILTPEDVWCSGESGVALTMAAVETVIPASIRRCAPEKVIYPPTVPPRSVRIAGIRFVAPASGTNVFFNALPTGGFTTMITTKITIIIMAPSTLVIVSMALLAFFSTNTRIAKRPASM